MVASPVNDHGAAFATGRNGGKRPLDWNKQIASLERAKSDIYVKEIDSD
jgi:hypothetical protein